MLRVLATRTIVFSPSEADEARDVCDAVAQVRPIGGFKSGSAASGEHKV